MPANGESLLMLAVLTDALYILRRYKNARKPRHRHLYEQAHAWLMTKDTFWLYAFENICAAFHIDADVFREKIKQMLQQPADDTSLTTPRKPPDRKRMRLPGSKKIR